MQADPLSIDFSHLNCLFLFIYRYAVHNAGVGMSLKKATHGNQSDNLREVLESRHI